MQRHRFAHAAAAQNAERLAGKHAEAHVIEHAVFTERLGDVLELDVGMRLGIVVFVMWVVGHVYAIASISGAKAQCLCALCVTTKVVP